MSIKEILEKQQAGIELNDAEKALLAEYQESLKTLLEMERQKHQEELSKINEKATSADTLLQDSLKKIEELENSKKELENSKKELEKSVQSSENIEDLKIKIREDLEKKKAEEKVAEQKKYEELLKSMQEANNLEIQKLREEMAKQKELNDKLEFKTFISAEIVKRPYLDVQLKKILEDMETTSLAQSKFIYNFLVGSVNHDTAMETFKKQQTAGQSIFNVDHNEGTPVKVEKKEDRFAEWLKKHPNIR